MLYIIICFVAWLILRVLLDTMIKDHVRYYLKSGNFSVYQATISVLASLLLLALELTVIINIVYFSVYKVTTGV